MGKTVSATDMLNAGRRDLTSSGAARAPTDERVDSTTRQLDAQSLKALTSGSNSQQEVETTSRLVPQSSTYQRITVFLTPDQRRWLKRTAKALPVDGLSASDVMRLAMNRLREDVDGGLALVEALTAQAHIEAATLAGRRNRGLPPRTEVAAGEYLPQPPR